MTPKHLGPRCTIRGLEFYYDYIPQAHDWSGLCWECYAEEKTMKQRETKPQDAKNRCDHTPLVGKTTP